jgi:hypothetical protein
MEEQLIDLICFSDRHFWHGDYDKAMLRGLITRPAPPGCGPAGCRAKCGVGLAAAAGCCVADRYGKNRACEIVGATRWPLTREKAEARAKAAYRDDRGHDKISSKLYAKRERYGNEGY